MGGEGRNERVVFSHSLLVIGLVVGTVIFTAFERGF
jgi:hypothetical protein